MCQIIKVLKNSTFLPSDAYLTSLSLQLPFCFEGSLRIKGKTSLLFEEKRKSFLVYIRNSGIKR